MSRGTTLAARDRELSCIIMIAPRKALWSTPDAVVQRIAALVDLTDDDDDYTVVVVDLGCGDGRVLLRWAELYTATSSSSSSSKDNNNADKKKRNNTKRPPSFIGIDTDHNRIQTAQQSWQRAVAEQRIASNISCQFHCANAVVDVDLWINDATIVYCYLTPRGMRLVRPLLLAAPRMRMVVSYMNELPNAVMSMQKELISVQAGTAWPLYFYKIATDGPTNNSFNSRTMNQSIEGLVI